MATERLSMRQALEILRQKLVLRRSHRDVARSVGVGLGTVGVTIARAREAGLDWATVEQLSEDALTARLYGPEAASRPVRPEPDCATIHAERRRPGVTLELLHLEYLERHPDGYRYTAFCDRYRRWVERHRLSMRQVHRAGEKAFVDYSGKRPWVVDPGTGERRAVELFVAVLGASNYTFAEATETQRVQDWVASHARAFVYFEGVPAAVVPDQLKSGVTSACRYEPEIQRTYAEMARHYGTTVLPARPASPRDKAKAEVGVQIVQRWILARLRNETFFSLDALNVRIAELLEDLNGRRMRLYGASRREMFERLDRPALRPLPPRPFVFAEWKQATVNIDYHVEVKHHYYSVPHALVRERVEVRLTATTVEVYLRGQRVASHPRDDRPAGHTTVAEHMPKAHRAHLEWSPTRIINWAASIGPRTRELVVAILESRPHPEQGYRSCLGILRLAKRYDDGRLEAACARAVAVRARSYRSVESILKKGLDRVPLVGPAVAEAPVEHENVRGGAYYE